MTAQAAASAISRGWRVARPGDRLDLLPISDGGDGFGEIFGQLLGAKVQRTKSVDAAGRRCSARWRWAATSKTAVIESANVIGIAMLPPGKFHPFDLDTFGLGAVIRAAGAKGAKRILIGIGGSATNDGGFGLARALGWKFFDRAGTEIGRWTELHSLDTIRAPAQRRAIGELIVAVDVRNPLLGARGATRVYGPQKGLRPGELALAERCLRRLADVVTKFGSSESPDSSDREVTKFHAMPGAGAAGGLGFGLAAFANARLASGFDLFAEIAELDQRLRPMDLVLTGEGRLDDSSFMGKGVGQLARRCRRLRIPCVALCGAVDPVTKTRRQFTKVFTMPAKIKPSAMTAAAQLQEIARQIASSPPIPIQGNNAAR